jgi:hypothetical protein
MREIPIQSAEPLWRQAISGAQILFVAFGALVLVPLLTGLNPSLALLGARHGRHRSEQAGPPERVLHHNRTRPGNDEGPRTGASCELLVRWWG